MRACLRPYGLGLLLRVVYQQLKGGWGVALSTLQLSSMTPLQIHTNDTTPPQAGCGQTVICNAALQEVRINVALLLTE